MKVDIINCLRAPEITGMFCLLLKTNFNKQPREAAMSLRRAPRFFGVIQAGQCDWPAPPHDPRERVHVTTVSNWQVRVYSEARARSLVPRGLWQVQLWEPDALLSVLTPSRATGGAYEALSVSDGWKVRVMTRTDLVRLVGREHAGPFVSEPALARLERWLVPRNKPPIEERDAKQ
jgi:hypothetical protein